MTPLEKFAELPADLRALLSAIEAHTGITFEMICSRCKRARYNDARRLFCYFAFKVLGYSSCYLSRVIERTHPTVLYMADSHKFIYRSCEGYRYKTDCILQFIENFLHDKLYKYVPII